MAFFLTAVLWAQGGLDRPRLGIVPDGSGRVRPVFGVAGSVTLGDPEGEGVISAACGSGNCLLKTRNAIVSGGIVTQAPLGPAVFAFDADATWVYFSLVRQLARWENGRLEFVAIAPEEEILSVRVRDSVPEFAVRRSSGTWIVDSAGQAREGIPTLTGPVQLLPDGVLYTSMSEIVLRRADDSEIRFPRDRVSSFSMMGEGFVQARSGRTSFVIRTVRGRERMFQLPEPAP